MSRNYFAQQFSMVCLPILLFGALAGSSASALQTEQNKEKVQRKRASEQLVKEMSQSFLVDWLQGHDEENIVVDADGVGINGNSTRIKALLYNSKESDGGYIVETEFQIKMPDGRTIIEFLAGTGETEEQAINDTLVNFTLSTYHVAYKAFMNPKDPHQQTAEIMIGEHKRILVLGETVTRSSAENPLGEFDLDSKLQTLFKDIELDEKTHWLKVVYGQHKGQAIAIVATLDNEGNEALTTELKKLSWPPAKGFYMTKKFVVIQSTK